MATLGVMDLGEKGLALLIPREIVKELGWKEGDEIVADIPMTGAELLLHRKDSQPRPTLGGVKEGTSVLNFPGGKMEID